MFIFFKLGGIWKRERHNRLFDFYWLFICILYQWSFLYWKLKKKKIYFGKKKNCLPSQCGLVSTRSWVWPLWWCQAIFLSLVCFFLSLKMPEFFLIWILLRSLHVSHFVNSFLGGGALLNRGKFHVSTCAVHIVLWSSRFRQLVWIIVLVK